MSYSDAKYGLERRIVIDEEDDVGSTGVSKGSASVSRKSKIIKFGLIPNDADVICSTTTTFVLELDDGTDLGSFTPGKATLGTGTATGVTITATSVALNSVVRVNVTEAGSSGSVNYYVDVREQFDTSDSA